MVATARGVRAALRRRHLSLCVYSRGTDHGTDSGWTLLVRFHTRRVTSVLIAPHVLEMGRGPRGSARGRRSHADGPVIGWGSSGDLWPPASVDGTDGTASAIAAGADFTSPHSCAIQAETGNVVCWGGNEYGQASPAASVNGTAGTASAIAAGEEHTLAIQAPEPTAGCFPPSLCSRWHCCGSGVPEATALPLHGRRKRHSAECRSTPCQYSCVRCNPGRARQRLPSLRLGSRS